MGMNIGDLVQIDHSPEYKGIVLEVCEEKGCRIWWFSPLNNLSPYLTGEMMHNVEVVCK
jgi:hypothetical protein